MRRGVRALKPGEDRQIIAYLSPTQTPEALNQRKAQAAAAASAGRSIVPRKAPPAPEQPLARGPYDGKVIAFISLVSLGALALIIRRPATAPRAPDNSNNTNTSASGPLILRLAS